MTEAYRQKIEGSLSINETISDERLHDMRHQLICGYRPSRDDCAALVATVEAYRNAPDERDQELDDANMRAVGAEVQLDRAMKIIEAFKSSERVDSSGRSFDPARIFDVWKMIVAMEAKK